MGSSLSLRVVQRQQLDSINSRHTVLHSTASEFVLSSRGCVEPCIRNAVITLQTYPVSHSQVSCTLSYLLLVCFCFF
ncbi:unnamed protein product [Trichobilharzia regenti]|nr:unnamed protein product [Trichobilharzia regenti]